MPRFIEASSIVVLVLSATACFPRSAPVPGAITPADVATAKEKWPDATDASLAAGRDTFTAKCNSCHDYPAMDAMTETQWPGTVHSMAGKAKLDATQERDVLRFVLTARARSSPR